MAAASGQHHPFPTPGHDLEREGPPQQPPGLHDVGPWPGLAVAAHAAVEDLLARFGMDLWMVTSVEDDRQVVVASAGAWSDLARPGHAFSWPESFCLQMVSRTGPRVEPDVTASPDLGPVAVGVLAVVRAYVGVPLLTVDDRLFGTLCAFAGAPQPPDLREALGHVRLLGRMLSTILAKEQTAADRSHEAAAAYALAERDRLTGLRNRRGWEAVLTQEELRVCRYGSPVSLLAVDLDELKQINDTGGHAAGDEALRACAQVLTGTCRPGDAVARLGGDEFGVLAVECDQVSVRALVLRLRTRLREAGVAASVGWATRRPQESLADTAWRADEAMYQDKRRRHGAAGRSAAPLPRQRTY